MIATNLLEFFRNPCQFGPIIAILWLFIAPISLTYIVTFPFFVLFPLGIILLLRIIETERVPQESSQNRGLLAARIVASLKRLRYRLSTLVEGFVGGWLEEIFDLDDANAFYFLSSCFLHSLSFSSSSLSSSPRSSLSSSSFHSSSPPYLESSQQAQSVLALPTSHHSTLPSQRAIVGPEWSSSPSLA